MDVKLQQIPKNCNQFIFFYFLVFRNRILVDLRIIDFVSIVSLSAKELWIEIMLYSWNIFPMTRASSTGFSLEDQCFTGLPIQQQSDFTTIKLTVL